MKRIFWCLSLLWLVMACSSDDADPMADDDIVIGMNDDDPMGGDDDDPLPPDPTGFTPCDEGMAGPFPCNGYDMLGRIALSTFGATFGNDIWGWTDTTTGKEYALVGVDNGTAFVDISDDQNLIYLGKLPTATTGSTWRDIKVYQDYAFIGSEAANHGMQVFDLTRLRNVANPPEDFTADTRFTGFGNSHNLVINEATGYAYAVGTQRADAFNGGAHFIDISDPMNPTADGGYGASGYTHDAHVVSYDGPDTDYTGREIFVGANENSVVIVDVTDKDAPSLITSFGYPNTGYTHQGWFTEDQRYFILGDETDELSFGFNSRTLVFDFSDLDVPSLHTTYTGPTTSIDHNGYVKGNQYFLANYTAGIRILDISEIDAGNIVEEGFFDTYPASDRTSFEGVWSIYPFFESGKIVLGDVNRGLFVIRSNN